MPIVGFTWYSLTDQIDWDIALREKNNTVNPLATLRSEPQIRPVGEAYKKLIQEWGGHLATETVCLTVPIASPEFSAFIPCRRPKKKSAISITRKPGAEEAESVLWESEAKRTMPGR